MMRLTRSMQARFDEKEEFGRLDKGHRRRLAIEKNKLNKCIRIFDDNDCDQFGPRLPAGFDYQRARDMAGRRIPGFKSVREAIFEGGAYVPIIVAGATAWLLAPLGAAAVGKLILIPASVP